jgi:hypothetical protein
LSIDNSLGLNLTESQTFVGINKERTEDERSKVKNDENESVGWKLNKREEERREEKIEEIEEGVIRVSFLNL